MITITLLKADRDGHARAEFAINGDMIGITEFDTGLKVQTDAFFKQLEKNIRYYGANRFAP